MALLFWIPSFICFVGVDRAEFTVQKFMAGLSTVDFAAQQIKPSQAMTN